MRGTQLNSDQTSTLTGEPTLAARYHLLLGLASDDLIPFEELVSENGNPHTVGRWYAAVEPALKVSAVEADARLARFTQDSGGYAIRISRLDPRTIWIAVHQNGQRLFVCPHQRLDGPLSEPPIPGLTLPVAAQILDPLLAAISEDGSPSPADRAQVAQKRSEEFSAALSEGGIEIEPSTISSILLGNNDPVPRLLDVLDASLALPLLRTGLEAPAFGLMVGGSKERQAVLQGCFIPGFVSVGSFVVAALWAKSAGASPFISLIFGTSIALFAGRAAARLSTRSLVPRATFRPTTTLQWASDQPNNPRPSTSARRLSADASNTWGGIFYLLRDIAFFSGWDRPRGPAALYIDAWGIGPPELVQTVEDVAAGTVQPTGLYALAKGLLEVRTKAISAHLGKATFTKQEVQDTVQGLVRTATK